MNGLPTALFYPAIWMATAYPQPVMKARRLRLRRHTSPARRSYAEPFSRLKLGHRPRRCAACILGVALPRVNLVAPAYCSKRGSNGPFQTATTVNRSRFAGLLTYWPSRIGFQTAASAANPDSGIAPYPSASVSESERIAPLTTYYIVP